MAEINMEELLGWIKTAMADMKKEIVESVEQRLQDAGLSGTDGHATTFDEAREVVDDREVDMSKYNEPHDAQYAKPVDLEKIKANDERHYNAIIEAEKKVVERDQIKGVGDNIRAVNIKQGLMPVYCIVRKSSKSHVTAGQNGREVVQHHDYIPVTVKEDRETVPLIYGNEMHCRMMVAYLHVMNPSNVGTVGYRMTGSIVSTE